MLALCPVCGKAFVRNSPSQLYCGNSCKGKAAYELKKKRNAAVATQKNPMECPVCGKIFVPRTGQKFCCNKCASKGRVTRNDSMASRGIRMVDIRITKPVPVFPQLQPKIGQVYRAEVSQCAMSAPFYVIPDIAGKKIVVRAGECEEVEHEVQV